MSATIVPIRPNMVPPAGMRSADEVALRQVAALLRTAALDTATDAETEAVVRFASALDALANGETHVAERQFRAACRIGARGDVA